MKLRPLATSRHIAALLRKLCSRYAGYAVNAASSRKACPYRRHIRRTCHHHLRSRRRHLRHLQTNTSSVRTPGQHSIGVAPIIMQEWSRARASRNHASTPFPYTYTCLESRHNIKIYTYPCTSGLVSLYILVECP